MDIYNYSQIGTLCDEPNGLTCSYDVAKKWGKAKEISSFSSFEEAANQVRNGLLPAFLVPAAYPKVNAFIMDKHLIATNSFIMQIPDLLLVGVTENIPLSVITLYHHPATTALLPETGVEYQYNVHATSNSNACIKLINDKNHSVAITNSLCAKFYKLKTYKILRMGILMPFICFESNAANDERY